MARVKILTHIVAVRLRMIVLTWIIVACAAAPAAASTVGDLMTAARAVLDSPLKSGNKAAADALSQALETLTSAGVENEDIDTFVAQYLSPDAIALARRRDARYTAAMKGAIDAIKAVTNVVLPALNVEAAELDKLVTELTAAEQRHALTWDMEVLRRLERKYGPGSAKLNGIEVLIAYSLQRVPGFGVAQSGQKKGEPGPFEVIFAYVPSYVTRGDQQMRLVSVFEAGLRQYFFGEKWGKRSGRASWLRPAYASYGLALSGGSDDPLRTPWDGNARVGAFFGWGKLKVAWVAGDGHRVLVTQQFQLIPWLF